MTRLLAPLLSLLLVAACSSSGSDDSNGSPPASTGVTGKITVFAAASLTEAFDTVKQKVEAKYPGTSITVEYGASSDLATQIAQGKGADVFASASTKNMDTVVQSGDASAPTDFVANTLEIAVPPGNPGKIKGLSDLARSGVKVGVCDAAVPCGAVAQQVFDNAELTVEPAANLEDVKSTLAVVESGEIDAGLVYVTDVRAAGSKVEGIRIPDDVNASTTYPIAILTAAGNRSLARAFVGYVLSPAGQRVLAADGFSKP